MVSIANGTGPWPATCNLLASSITREASAGLLGERLLALLDTVAKAPADGRGWNQPSPTKSWAISDEPRTLPSASRTYVGRFNFKGGDQQKFVKDLSGGERGRLHLALTLKEGGNVLLLDEPSNDLDVETLRSLEEALLDFPGAAIVISHDRWFLDRVATHILAYEDDSQAVFFEGNYTEYEADRKKRLGEAASQPHRVRHKKLA